MIMETDKMFRSRSSASFEERRSQVVMKSCSLSEEEGVAKITTPPARSFFNKSFRFRICVYLTAFLVIAVTCGIVAWAMYHLLTEENEDKQTDVFQEQCDAFVKNFDLRWNYVTETSVLVGRAFEVYLPDWLPIPAFEFLMRPILQSPKFGAVRGWGTNTRIFKEDLREREIFIAEQMGRPFRVRDWNGTNLIPPGDRPYYFPSPYVAAPGDNLEGLHPSIDLANMQRLRPSMVEAARLRKATVSSGITRLVATEGLPEGMNVGVFTFLPIFFSQSLQNERAQRHATHHTDEDSFSVSDAEAAMLNELMGNYDELALMQAYHLSSPISSPRVSRQRPLQTTDSMSNGESDTSVDSNIDVDMDPLADPDLFGFQTELIRLADIVAASKEDVSVDFGIIIEEVTEVEEYEWEILYNDTNMQSVVDAFKTHHRNLSINNRIWNVQCVLAKSEDASIATDALLICVAMTFVILIIVVIVLWQLERLERASRRVAEAYYQQGKEREKAEKAGQAKADFLSNMSHELRTPLNGVIGIIQTLRDSLPAEVLDTVEKDLWALDLCADLLLTTVNDILDVSKLVAGKMKLSLEKFTLQELIVGSVVTVSLQATKKNIRLTHSYDRNHSGFFLGDQVRLRQIIINFVSNAVKFTPVNGEVSVNIEVDPLPPGYNITDNNYSPRDGMEDVGGSSSENENSEHSDWRLLHIYVQDSGIGISPEQQEKIFADFQQADTSITRIYGGTGLGLSICKKLVGLMGGEIGVNSEAGQGSIFYVKCPLRYSSEMCGPGYVEVDGEQDEDEPYEEENIARQLSSVLSSRRLSDASDIHREQSLEKTLEPAERRLMNLHIVRNLPPSSTPSGSPGGSFVAKTPSRDSVIATELPNPPRKLKKARKVIPVFKGVHTLVVEDNEINQRVICRFLEMTGVTFEVANNGLLGLEKSKETKFDLIFMDCHMPIMDGFSSAAHIKSDPTNRNYATPIVALTADVEQTNESRCKTSGMTHFLSKPLNRFQLWDVIGGLHPSESQVHKNSGEKGCSSVPLPDAPADCARTHSGFEIMTPRLGELPQPRSKTPPPTYGTSRSED